MRDSKLKLKLALVSGGAGLAFAMAAMPVHAQTQSGAAAPAGEAQENEDERIIIVTGTNIRGVAPVGASTAAVTRKDIEESGLSQVSDLLRQLPQTQSTSNYSDVPMLDGPNSSPVTGGGGFFTNPTRGSATDLRGLGPQATLVLIDGRRQLATGTTSSFVEANRVPLAALERIEIVSDGASAVYGSDAVAGVVNYITRKDYQGIEASGRYTTNKSYDQWGLSVTAGTHWNLGGRDGNIIVTYDYDHRNRMTYADNPRTVSNQTPYGGSNWLNNISGTNPFPAGSGYLYFTACPTPSAIVFGGNCLVPPTFANEGPAVTQYANIPTGVTGAPAMAGSSVSTSLPSNIQTIDQYRVFLPETDRHSVNAYLNQELTDGISMYAQFTGSWRKVHNLIATDLPVTVNNDSPYFPTGLPASVTSVTVPLRIITRPTARDTQYSATIGTKFNLSSSWRGEIYGSYAKANQNPGNGDIANQQVVQGALNRLVLRGEYNPFAGAASDAVLSKARFGPNQGMGDLGHSSAWNFVAKVNGSLFSMPGGEAKAAIGTEYTRFTNVYQQVSPQAACPNFTSTGAGSGINAQPCSITRFIDPTRSGTAQRDIYAGFAELYLPLVGPDNAMPLVQSLDLNLAARWEHYSDFGNTFNPRVGVSWGVTDSLSLRGSWGKAFRAPNLTEVSASSLPIFAPSGPNASGDPRFGPAAGSAALILGGANPNLGPEKATNWSFGFNYDGKDALEGLQVSGTYYNIHYKDKIVALPLGQFLSSPANAQIYSQFLIPITTPVPTPGCDPNNPATYAPQVRALLSSVPIFTVGDICQTSFIMDARWQNAASVFQDGIDFNLRYNWEWEKAGRFNVGVNLTKILHIKEELIKGKKTTPDPIDRVFQPLSFRARGNVGWAKGPFSANLAVNYTPGYTNDVGFVKVNAPPAADSAPLATTKIGSWTTADLNLAYSLPRDQDGLLAGLRLSVNVNNLFNTDAPIALIGRTDVSYDSRAANPYGRTFAFQVTKAF